MNKACIVITFFAISTLALAQTALETRVIQSGKGTGRPVAEEHAADTTTEAFLRLPVREQIQIIYDIIIKYRRDGIGVKYTAIEYLDIIKSVLAKNPDYIGMPLGEMLRQLLTEEGSLPGESEGSVRDNLSARSDQNIS